MKNQLRLFTSIFLFNLLFFQTLNAQTEMGFGIGASVFQGDLGGSLHNSAFNIGDLDYQSIRGLGQGFIRITVNKKIRAKANLTFAQIAGSDEFAGNPTIKARGIKMSGNVLQISTVAEISILKKYKVYGIIGIGYALFNQSVWQNGILENNNGSGMDNSCLSIPVGMGFKLMDVGYKGKLELEAIAHYLTSDKLDGVYGGNSKSNDTYTFVTLNYSFLLGNHIVNPTKFKRSKQFKLNNYSHCPEF